MTKVLQIRCAKPINLYAFTDVHIGAKGHDADCEMEVRRQIRKLKDFAERNQRAR